MRLADPIPSHCSACFNQQSVPHIDFEAAWDGPVLNPQEVLEGKADAQPIDDLFLCENCVKSAARLLGMVDENDSRVSQLEHELRHERDRRQEVEQYAGGLELAVQNAPRKPVRRPPGRPRKEAVEA